MNTLKAIPEYQSMSEQQFLQGIVPAQKPIVIRGHSANWPVTQAAIQSDERLVDYLSAQYNGSDVMLYIAPPEANKRYYYNQDLTGFTFGTVEKQFDRFLKSLLAMKSREEKHALSMQSAVVDNILPTLTQTNGSNLIKDVTPRLWVGNQGIVDIHYDGSDNLACVVAGKRRFTLFAPNQTSNLYPGPLDFNPAGVPVSMVDLHNPDFERFPRFKTALDNAYSVELEAGDAIFIPMLWWHHVVAHSDVNALLNYWWNGSFAKDAQSPNFMNSMKIAMFAMRDMTPKQKSAWRNLFNHYLFKRGVDPADYIPEHQLGLLGELDPEYIRQVKDFFANKFKD